MFRFAIAMVILATFTATASAQIRIKVTIGGTRTESTRTEERELEIKAGQPTESKDVIRIAEAFIADANKRRADEFGKQLQTELHRISAMRPVVVTSPCRDSCVRPTSSCVQPTSCVQPVTTSSCCSNRSEVGPYGAPVYGSVGPYGAPVYGPRYIGGRQVVINTNLGGRSWWCNCAPHQAFCIRHGLDWRTVMCMCPPGHACGHGH